MNEAAWMGAYGDCWDRYYGCLKAQAKASEGTNERSNARVCHKSYESIYQKARERLRQKIRKITNVKTSLKVGALTVFDNAEQRPNGLNATLALVVKNKRGFESVLFKCPAGLLAAAVAGMAVVQKAFVLKMGRVR